MTEAEVVIEIPFHDVDVIGVVWHGHYFKYLEIARCALLEKIDDPVHGEAAEWILTERLAHELGHDPGRFETDKKIEAEENRVTDVIDLPLYEVMRTIPGLQHKIARFVELFRDDMYGFGMHGAGSYFRKLEGLNDQEQLTLEIAAILHDVGIKESERKYNSSSAKYQHLEGPPVARELLKDLDLDEKLIDRVCFMIGNHHTYTKVDKIDFQILFEADFLVNMYESRVKKGRILEIQEKIFKTKSGK